MIDQIKVVFIEVTLRIYFKILIINIVNSKFIEQYFRYSRLEI